MSYTNYKGKSCGKLLHFINEYCTLHLAEQVIVGDGKISYCNKPFAKVKWIVKELNEVKIDVPVFTFFGENKEIWEKEQNIKQEVAIIQSKEYHDSRGDKAWEDYHNAYANMIDERNNLSEKVNTPIPELDMSDIGNAISYDNGTSVIEGELVDKKIGNSLTNIKTGKTNRNTVMLKIKPKDGSRAFWTKSMSIV